MLAWATMRVDDAVYIDGKIVGHVIPSAQSTGKWYVDIRLPVRTHAGRSWLLSQFNKRDTYVTTVYT